MRELLNKFEMFECRCCDFVLILKNLKVSYSEPHIECAYFNKNAIFLYSLLKQND